jgi:hypothetical protein
LRLAADRRRQHVERKAVIAAIRAWATLLGTVIVVGKALVATRTVRAVETLVAIGPVAAVLPITTFGAILTGLIAALGHLVLAVVLVHFLVTRTAWVLFLKAGAAFAQDAEIVIGELKLIFGLDAVARKLRVARHALVFLEQLGGIAALTVVLPIARLPAEILAPLPTTTATAAALTIVDQIPTSLRSVSKPLRLWQAGRRACASSDPLVPV